MKMYIAFAVAMALAGCQKPNEELEKKVDEVCANVTPEWTTRKTCDWAVRSLHLAGMSLPSIRLCHFSNLPAFCAEDKKTDSPWPVIVWILQEDQYRNGAHSEVRLTRVQADKAVVQKDPGDREACTLAGLSVFCKKSADGRLQVYHPNGMLMYDFSADEWRNADPRMLSIP